MSSPVRRLLAVPLGWTFCLGVVVAVPALARAELARTFRSERPVADEVFEQPVVTRIPSAQPVRAVALDGAGSVWAGTDVGLFRVDGTNWVAIPGVTGGVRRLVRTGEQVWAITAQGLEQRRGEQWARVGTDPVVDLCQDGDATIAATAQKLFRVREGVLEPLPGKDCAFPITRVVAHTGGLYVHGAGRISTYSRGRFGAQDVYDFYSDQAWDFGALPSPRTRDVVSAGSQLLIATDRGVGVLRGMSLTAWRGGDGLPYEDITCVAANGADDVWLGTSHGLVRHHAGRWDYFAGDRWLPGQNVAAIAVDGSRIAVATDAGLSLIRLEPYTLAKQAAYYEQHLETWGQKRLGLTHKLEWDEARGEFVREMGDNDGGYSGDYLAAQCYRYAVTGDPAARREATNTFYALRWLEVMTGVPGLAARAVWAKGEIGHKALHGSGGFPAEWHDTKDGAFEWKGDTSSDELCSHFYAVGLFLDLVAQGDEIGHAKTHLVRQADHLIRNGWQLWDLDGKPTRWGRWDPEYLRTDEGRYDRGLQAVELLSFIRTAAALTGEPRFTKAYQQLGELGYPDYTLRQRATAPPESILHFEDQLAFWCYWNLLRLEPDAELRSLYRRSFERSYEIVRVEQQPWLNFIHAALTGDTGEVAVSVQQLREWPLDLRVWSYQNSHRTDLRTPPGYVALKAGAGAAGGLRPFSAREREPMRWDGWMMQADGGAGGRDVVEPGGWLLAYWMGRYHGFIAAPTTTRPELLEVQPGEVPAGGARPYAGPPRPPVE